MVSRERNGKMPMPAAKAGMLVGMALAGGLAGSSATAFVATGVGGGAVGRPRPARSSARCSERLAPLPPAPPAAAVLGAAGPPRMSSIGHDDPDETPGGGEEEGGGLGPRATNGGKKGGFSWREALPPPPEDQIVMSGDIAVIFVYSFLDHTLNDIYASALSSGSGGTAAALDPTLAADFAASQQVPVWFDSAAAAASGMTVLPALGYVPYAPAISTAGTSAVVLTTAWLLAGYVSGAFLFRNTLECSTQRAVSVAGTTWVGATVLAAGVALASDALGGWCDCVHNPSLGGLTKADADFLFGTLSVLAMWRFILSWILGYGGSDE